MNRNELTPAASDVSPLDMKETDVLVIDSQIVAGIEASDGREAIFLNNFEATLPGGFQREIVNSAGLNNQPMVKQDDLGLHSEKSYVTTYSSFFNDIDDSVRITGIGKRLAMLRQTYDISDAMGKSAIREIICKEALPAYSYLRQIGYSHYDLWR